MNQVNQTVLALLRGAVWGEKITLSAEADWQAVTREMQAQTVLSMVAGADLPEEIPETVRFQWQRAALYQGAQFYRLLHAQDEMVELLEGHGFHPAILKGMAAAIYYPAPETRTMGDIDFILPREELEAGFSLLRENGYVLEAEEDVNNKHILLAKSEAHFELHRYFGKFDSVEKMQRMDELVQDGLHHLDHSPCAGSSTPVLPALVNGIILLEHAAGHIVRITSRFISPVNVRVSLCTFDVRFSICRISSFLRSRTSRIPSLSMDKCSLRSGSKI